MEVKDFLSTLHGGLREDEAVLFNITRKGDTLSMSFIPSLSGVAEDTNKETEDIRAALAIPLVFNDMTLDEISNELKSRLTGYSEARTQALSAYDELVASLKDATAGAKNATVKTAKSKPTDAPKKATPAKTPAKASGSPTATKPAEKAGVLDF